MLPLLNGLEHMDVLRARFGDRVAAGTISHYQAYRAGRVQIVEATPPPLITLASETLSRTEVEQAADMLRRARMDVRVGQSEKRVLWHKLARIAPLAAVTSVSGRTLGELRNDPKWRPRLDSAIVEACAVAEADGVSLRASRPVGDHRRDGRRDHDLCREGRRRRPAVRAGRDPGRRPPHRRAARRVRPDAHRARRRRRSQVSAARAVAFVPARSGSERVPGKNIRALAGHPLLAYAIETARQSGCFERVVVSTDSEEIADVARWYGADVPFLRPAEYATSTSPDVEWLAYTLERLEERYDLFALIRATNPFRGPDVVRRGLDQLLATPEADSVRAVERVKQHPGKMWLLAEDGRTMSSLLDQSDLEVAWHAGQYQALPEVYVQNSALEIAWTRVVAETGTREGNVLAPFLTDGLEGFNVDDEEDWQRAERLVAAGDGDAHRGRAATLCSPRSTATLCRPREGRLPRDAHL